VFVGTLGGYGLGVRFVSEFIALLSQDKHIKIFEGGRDISHLHFYKLGKLPVAPTKAMTPVLPLRIPYS